MFDALRDRGFDIAIRNHAGAILSIDFPEITDELEQAPLFVSIPAEELIKSGGCEAQSTQSLCRALYDAGWPKHNFSFRLIVDGVETVGFARGHRGIFHDDPYVYEIIVRRDEVAFTCEDRLESEVVLRRVSEEMVREAIDGAMWNSASASI